MHAKALIPARSQMDKKLAVTTGPTTRKTHRRAHGQLLEIQETASELLFHRLQPHAGDGRIILQEIAVEDFVNRPIHAFGDEAFGSIRNCLARAPFVFRLSLRSALSAGRPDHWQPLAKHCKSPSESKQAQLPARSQ